MEKHNQQQEACGEISVFDWLILVLQHKVFVLKFTVSVVFLAAVVSLILPSKYLAETRILPPQTTGSSMAAAFAAQTGSINAALLGIKTTNDLYMELLRARDVADYVIERTAFTKDWPRIRSADRLRGKLKSGLMVRNDRKSGIMTIGYAYGDPVKAAAIANAFVEGLQRLNNKLAVTEAATRRLFFEEQLKNSKENLVRAEEALKSFQQRTGTIKIDEEARATVGTVAQIRARISAKEVQLRVMNAYATPQNPDLQRLQDEITALKSELYKLGSGAVSEDDSVSTVGSISSLGTEYLRRMRDFKYNEALYEILLKQYEAAKLDESRDAALVQVVDTAIPPESRFQPQRRAIVFNSAAAAFVLAVLFVFLRGYLASLKLDPGTRDKLESLRALLEPGRLARECGAASLADRAKRLFRGR